MQLRSVFSCHVGALLTRTTKDEAERDEKHLTDPEGQAKLSLKHRGYRRILSREMPGQDVSSSKMTPGIWREQIQGGRRGGYRGSAREAQSSGEGGQFFIPDVGVTKSHTPDHPPFQKLN